MTTLTIKIPDNKTESITKIIKKTGGDIISQKSDLSKAEQASLNKGIEQARLIQAGQLKGFSFDELWD